MGTGRPALAERPGESAFLFVAVGLVVLLLAVGVTAPEPGPASRGAVERLDLEPIEAIAVLRTQLTGAGCESLLMRSTAIADEQYVTLRVPELGVFEVQVRRRGQYTVQPRSAVSGPADCEWADGPIPTNPLGR